MDYLFFIRPFNRRTDGSSFFYSSYRWTCIQNPTDESTFFIRPIDGHTFENLSMDHFFSFVLLMDIQSKSYRLIISFFISPIDGHTFKMLSINHHFFRSSYQWTYIQNTINGSSFFHLSYQWKYIQNPTDE